MSIVFPLSEMFRAALIAFAPSWCSADEELRVVDIPPARNSSSDGLYTSSYAKENFGLGQSWSFAMVNCRMDLLWRM